MQLLCYPISQDWIHWSIELLQEFGSFIVGDLDLTYNAPGAKDYIHKGGFKRDVPLLEDEVVIEGVGHFLHQEKADEINKHIGYFFSKFHVRPRHLPIVYVGIVAIICSIIVRFLFVRRI
ncbi:hypothetical protein Lal_00006528 [Lupinus albus]|nr:hypothetical protein Lal_00006528 [Lupinus albus]